MHFSPTCHPKKPERLCSKTILLLAEFDIPFAKIYHIIVLTSLFDRSESGFVQAKKYLACHFDWRPAVHYFQPWQYLSVK